MTHAEWQAIMDNATPGAVKPEALRILCHECDRGGNGSAPDKCSCGRKHRDPTTLGCFLGEPFPDGWTPPPLPKLTRSQQRYRRWIDAGECFENFREFLKYDAHRQEVSRG